MAKKEDRAEQLKSPRIPEEAADFEKAIESTGYGRFNYLLLVVAMPCCFCSVFETTTMSLILPSAECDLKLSLVDKGVLNAITYAGMISSAFMWGFLSDILGRKKLLVYGYLVDGVCNIFCAFSQSYASILVFKFIGGFIMCGPFAVLMSYISEFHGLKHRSRVMMYTGIFFSLASIILPLLAWIIIPNPAWKIKFVAYSLELRTWQSFLLVCSLPSIISGLLVAFLLPESPKFLMSRGRNHAAMEIFIKIHRMNYGPNVEYPIKTLVVEKTENLKTDETEMSAKNKKSSSKLMNAIRGGFSQMAVMFEAPHLKNAILVYTIQFCILFGLNTFRLWIVQLFAIIEEYENEIQQFSIDVASEANLCTMIEYKVNKTQHAVNFGESSDSVCEANSNGKMFFNSMLISVIQLVLYIMASSVINAIGNKKLLIVGLLISGTCGIGLYWAKDALTTLLLSAGYISIASIASTTLVGSIVSLFPTSTRTMTVSLAMMFGRSGAIIGNLLFPWLMSFGCLPPFAMVGSTAIICSFVCFMIPKTTQKALQ